MVNKTDMIVKQLQDVIRESLPAQVGDELRKYLDAANDNEIALKESQEYTLALIKERDELKAEVSRQVLKLAKHTDLDRREAEVGKRENVWEVTKAQLERDEAVKRSTDILQLVGTLVKNPVFKSSVTGSGYIPPGREFNSGSAIEEMTTE